MIFFKEQFKEIKEFFNLDFTGCKFLSRCAKCNGNEIIVMDKNEAKKELNWDDENEFSKVDEYTRCSKCKQIYWKGSTSRKAQIRFENLSSGKI